jgi:hypothetical protein
MLKKEGAIFNIVKFTAIVSLDKMNREEKVNRDIMLKVNESGMDIRFVIDNHQEKGITVAPLKVEVWVSICRSKKEKLLLSPTRVPQF